MPTFRTMKRGARGTIRRHTALMILLSFLIVFIGSESNAAGEIFRQGAGDEISTHGMISSEADFLNEVLQDQFPELYAQLHEKETSMDDSAEDLADLGGGSAIGTLLSSFFSGQAFSNLARSVYGAMTADSSAAKILIPLGFLFYALIWFFLLNMIPAAAYRVILEARVYEKVSPARLLHFRNVRRWRRAAGALFLVRLYQVLWNLTIVGGIIKHFSYRMTPFLIAENPDLKAKEAITLSRAMMDGHKWELFLFELSFLGWHLLGIASFGIAELFWTVPYTRAGLAEYYANLRTVAREAGVPGTERLDDRTLFTPPEAEELAAVYADIAREEAWLRDHPATVTGLRGVLVRWLGIWIGSAAGKAAYEDAHCRELRIRDEREAAAGLAYPERLNPLCTEPEKARSGQISWARCYTLWSGILLFLCFSFAGWLWEVSLYLVQDHQFYNRGLLHGPWLPIYGAGGILIILLLTRLREKPGIELTAAILLAGVVEYSIARHLELGPQHARYWDYHAMLANLDGRICALSLATFGLMGMLVVYLIAPWLDQHFSRLPAKAAMVLAVALLAVFLTDLLYSNFVNPNGGSGVAVDITEGEWPTTFWNPDHLMINGIMVYTMDEALHAEGKE